VRGRWKFATTPLAVVDLVAILPSLTPALGFDLRFLRALRLFRVLRLGKLFRYSESLHLLGRVIRREREALVMTLVILALLLLMSSIAMYFAEREAQPLMFSSVPATMWWSMGTVTAVGAGEMEPVTTLGRLLGVFIGFLGIASVALPTGILGAGFVKVFEDRRQRPRCPQCDAEIP